MIIVTTPGRSGSSLLMAYFKKINLKIGKLRWLHYFSAGMELGAVVRINAQFRNKIIYNQPLRDSNLYTSIKQLSLEVIKDPQFLIHPEIIEHWWAARKDIKVIYLTREPEQIVSSLRRHPTMNSPIFRNHVDLIEKHETDFLQRLEKKNIPYRKFVFPYFVNQIDDINKCIKEFGIKKPGNAEIWNNMVNRKKIHEDTIN